MDFDHDRGGRHTDLMAWLSTVVARSGRELSPDLLCALARDRLAVDGTLVVISVDRAAPFTHATDDDGRRLAELELIAGEGPMTSATETESPVLVPDLSAPAARSRWPLFGQLNEGLAISAVCAFPMAIGMVKLGAFGIHRTAAGLPPDPVLREARRFARIAMDLVVAGTAPLTTPQIHQATGMVAVQLGVDVSTAFASLRARAFTDGRAVADLADDVVARRVRFENDEHHPRSEPPQRGDELP
ncbi:ANTAR domain-containing protein [Actinokineospora inagensis]|uniref:ANTAR domain-containing protein n=1 Tax=Actinokineospora inagensis TaxID=103730 RepID=UPI00042363F7|nr:ANTAR domain-containing protein [Actinokineospora inagensis]